jgi:Flp pilus assembly protein TadG
MVMEFAVVAPFFLLLIFSMFEFGRLMMINQILTDAAREGARRAVLEGATVEGVQARVQSLMQDCRLDNATVDVAPTNLDELWVGDEVSVTVQVKYAEHSWISQVWAAGNPTMTATSTMRVERPE